MLPQEAAGVIVDEIMSDHRVLNFRVLDHHPTVINDYDGFKIVFTYKTRDGSVFKTVYYGLLKGDYFYSLRYNAAQGHFSQEDMDTFQKVIRSFRIAEERAGPKVTNKISMPY
jgi:hypothetical protein